MRALYYDKFKGYKGITIGDRSMPELDGNEILVRVKAFSLNYLDVWIMNGAHKAQTPLPHIFGSDASGVVEKVGDKSQHVKSGDEVIVFPGLSCGYCESCMSGHDNECARFSVVGVMTDGVSAEFMKAPAVNIFKKPDGLTFEEAAGIGVTYTTAWNSLIGRTDIKQGDTILIHAAGSGVGTALIQVAKLYNATVITTVGDDWKAPKAQALGADFVINYRREDFVEAVKRITKGVLVDIAVDHVGSTTFYKTLSCLKRGGRVVTFGATAGDEVPISLTYLFGKNITLHGVYLGPKSSAFEYLKMFPHKLRTVVDSVFEFKDAQQAYEKLLSRQIFGKIVVKL
ncbi:MAG TPA: zinc-binding dehydrogenase [Nitrospirota bacterium]|nr:zinc-binding dehydrogenase [Nitrospirota bacterium]